MEGIIGMVTRKRCALCNSPDRDEIERRLEQEAESADVIDSEYDWPSGTTSRHQRNHMGNYVNSSNPRCALCTFEGRSVLEEQLSDGRMSPAVAAKILDSSENQVKRHMTNHLQPLVQESAAMTIARKEVDEIDTLSVNIERLEDKLDSLFHHDDLDPKYIDSLTKLAKEVRESLRYLLEFKGKLVHKRQDTVIITQMQIIQEVLAQNHPDVWVDVRSKLQEKMQ
jgi:hypothetical protein|tara:strand:+ start:479 stop:1153 length:675 start_codon:yes stop_codon:yes gene_type:complete